MNFNLQLAGYDLQKENPTEVEEAINQLKQISEGQNISTKRLVQSVVDLFNDNWGRRDGKLSLISMINVLIEYKFI